MSTYSETSDGIGSYDTAKGERRYRVVLWIAGETKTKGGFRTKGEAKAWRDRTRNELRTGAYISDAKGRTTFGEFAADWMASPPRPLRPTTEDVYRSMLKSHLAYWSDVPLANITETEVRRWVAKLRQTKAYHKETRLSDGTVTKYYRLLKRILGSALRENYINRDPCQMEMNDGSPDLYCPTPTEVMLLANAVPQRYRAMILLAGYGGLRWGELVGLKRRHVNISAGCVTVEQAVGELYDGTMVVGPPKTKAGVRTVYLVPAVLDALALQLAQFSLPGLDGLVFPSDEGAYLRRANFGDRIWRKALLATGLPHTRFHDLRHAAATMTAQSGATTAELMAQIGHASPRAAMRYQHASDDRMKSLPARLAHLIPADTAATGTDNVIQFKRP